MNQIIAHIDMDCFFAAVEEKHMPELKGKPLVIGSLPGQRGVVATANYTARKFGIKSAMPTWKAEQLCKDAIFKKGNHKLYKEESNNIMEILKKFATDFEQVSIDEAYLNITDFAIKQKSLTEAARLIKKEVLKYTKLTCSIGISDSRYVSKIASDIKKPAGTTIVSNNKEFLKPLKINKIPGIGKVAYKKMIDLNINTIGDLAKANKFKLLDNFGKHIIKFQNLAKGEDKTGVSSNIYSKHKSISKETTFLEDINLYECNNHVETIANKVHQELQKYGYKTVSIKIKYSDFQTITRDYSLKTTSKTKEEIIKKARILLNQIPNNKQIRLFGIKLSNLIDNFQSQTTITAFI